MRAASREVREWSDGFLFVANRPILDLLNTKPVLTDGPTELLPDVRALERWLIASGTVTSAKAKATLRRWRDSAEAGAFLEQLIAFREKLREAALRMESGFAPADAFLAEVNSRLMRHPLPALLHKRDGKVIRETSFELHRPADLWAPIIHATADLVAESDLSRIRMCESCVLHFFDTSKKGSRRWCSMNICGNKLKVAAYQKRRKRKRTTPTDFQSVDEYIAAQPEAVQGILGLVRSTIRKGAPEADEGISYRIPTYKLHGRAVLYFAGWKQHYSLYPASSNLVAAFKDELRSYKISKGTIRFPLSVPVPIKLIERIAKFLAQEAAGREKAAAVKKHVR